MRPLYTITYETYSVELYKWNVITLCLGEEMAILTLRLYIFCATVNILSRVECTTLRSPQRMSVAKFKAFPHSRTRRRVCACASAMSFYPSTCINGYEHHVHTFNVSMWALYILMALRWSFYNTGFNTINIYSFLREYEQWWIRRFIVSLFENKQYNVVSKCLIDHNCRNTFWL